jgi:hypothetical protein
VEEADEGDALMESRALSLRELNGSAGWVSSRMLMSLEKDAWRL